MQVDESGLSACIKLTKFMIGLRFRYKQRQLQEASI